MLNKFDIRITDHGMFFKQKRPFLDFRIIIRVS